MMDEVRAITGVPDEARMGDRAVAVVEWRDGSVLDVVRELEPTPIDCTERMGT